MSFFNPKHYHYTSNFIDDIKCEECELPHRCYIPNNPHDGINCEGCIKDKMNHKSYYANAETLEEENKRLKKELAEAHQQIEELKSKSIMLVTKQ